MMNKKEHQITTKTRAKLQWAQDFSVISFNAYKQEDNQTGIEILQKKRKVKHIVRMHKHPNLALS